MTSEEPGPRTFETNGVAGPEVLGDLHDLVASAAASCPATADAMAFETAAMEVVGNLVKHAPGASFVLRVQVSDSELTAVLEDDGEPPLLPPGGLDDISVWAESGRGLGIARAALDELSLERVEGHNRWTLGRHVRPTAR